MVLGWEWHQLDHMSALKASYVLYIYSWFYPFTCSEWTADQFSTDLDQIWYAATYYLQTVLRFWQRNRAMPEQILSGPHRGSSYQPRPMSGLPLLWMGVCAGLVYTRREHLRQLTGIYRPGVLPLAHRKRLERLTPATKSPTVLFLFWSLYSWRNGQCAEPNMMYSE